MGQQQLLLLVLSAIIVGTSIVVGINMFSASAYQANREAVLEDAVTIATKAQEWFRKPALLDGGGRSFQNIELVKLGFPATNANGTYTLGSITDTTVTVTATGQEDGDGDSVPFGFTMLVTPNSVGNPANIED